MSDLSHSGCGEPRARLCSTALLASLSPYSQSWPLRCLSRPKLVRLTQNFETPTDRRTDSHIDSQADRQTQSKHCQVCIVHGPLKSMNDEIIPFRYERTRPCFDNRLPPSLKLPKRNHVVVKVPQVRSELRRRAASDEEQRLRAGKAPFSRNIARIAPLPPVGSDVESATSRRTQHANFTERKMDFDCGDLCQMRSFGRKPKRIRFGAKALFAGNCDRDVSLSATRYSV